MCADRRIRNCVISLLLKYTGINSPPFVIHANFNLHIGGNIDTVTAGEL